jgi:hypothetical protein
MMMVLSLRDSKQILKLMKLVQRMGFRKIKYKTLQYNTTRYNLNADPNAAY